MLRPFKSNEFYKKYVFFMKVSLYSILLLVLIFVLLFFELDQITLLIIVYAKQQLSLS